MLQRIFFVLCLASVAAGDVVLDFDRRGTPEHLGRPQNATVEWAQPPAATERAGGQAMRIRADERSDGFVFTRANVLPAITEQALFRMQVYVSREMIERDASIRMEVQMLEPGGAASFWRRVDVEAAGWTQVEVPLRHMRLSSNRYPRWNRIAHLGLLVETGAEVWVDQVELIKKPDLGPEMSLGELAELAFGERMNQQIVGGDAALLTDSQEIDLRKLHGHLKTVVQTMRRDLPLPRQLDAPAVLLVFAEREDYRQFIPRFAGLLNAKADPPDSGGYTLQRVASSFWLKEFGTLRPVYTHEFVHSVLGRAFALPDNGDWLQEGLASLYQLEFHPEGDLNAMIARSLADPRRRLKLSELCSGKRIGLDNYWQAMTVCHYLLRDPVLREQVPALLESVYQNRSTDLEPFIKNTLRSDWTDFEEGWLTYCRKVFRAPATTPRP